MQSLTVSHCTDSLTQTGYSWNVIYYLDNTSMTTWAREVTWPIKKKYLLFCNTYDQKSWQGSGLWWGKLIHDATWSSDHVVTWGHVANWKLNISYSTNPVTTKLNRAVSNDQGEDFIHHVTWLSDHKVTWGHVTNKKRNFFFAQRVWPQKLAG